MNPLRRLYHAAVCEFADHRLLFSLLMLRQEFYCHEIWQDKYNLLKVELAIV